LVIGEPVDCSGVIGAESFATLGLPSSLKLGEICALTLVSPSQLEIRFSPPSPLAYVVDRAAFDRTIADKTSASGVTLHLGSRVIDLQMRDRGVEVVFEEKAGRQSPTVKGRRVLKASVVILAGGPRYRLQRKLGMGQPGDFLRTAQAEVAVRSIKETKVLMGSHVAPGSFAWIVPFRRGSDEFARLGVSAKISSVPYLKKLLGQLHSEGHLSSPNVPIRSWVIPITPLPCTFAERVLVVGDAGGQTKPTTGGGIFYGLLCAEAAADTVVAAFQKGDFSAEALSAYEREWQRRLGREISTGSFFRRLAERLTDEEIDDLFRIVQSDGILASVTKKARFDWHRDVIYFALRHPALARIFLKGVFR
jgi:flavin-dependent dehydrogenase